MNLIDFIHNNIFLKKLFPNGIENNEVMIGRFSVDLSMHCEIDFHISQKPDIEVHKFGTWGEKYNTVVIETSGLIGEDIQIRNWRQVDFQKLKINKDDDIYTLSVSNENFHFHVTVSCLSFQKVSTYLNCPDEQLF